MCCKPVEKPISQKCVMSQVIVLCAKEEKRGAQPLSWSTDHSLPFRTLSRLVSLSYSELTLGFMILLLSNQFCSCGHVNKRAKQQLVNVQTPFSLIQRFRILVDWLTPFEFFLALP